MSRRQRIGLAFSTFVAFAAGVVMLVSLLLGGRPELYAGLENASVVALVLSLPAAILTRLVAITAAVAIVIGAGNLLYVHMGRLARGGLLSAVLLGSFALTVYWHVARAGDASLLEAVQVPIESALAGLLFLTMAQGGARILRKRADVWGLLFAAVVVAVLLGSLAYEELGPLRAWSDWLMAVPVGAGARAILLGIAMGAVVTGMRVLLGKDGAYRG